MTRGKEEKKTKEGLVSHLDNCLIICTERACWGRGAIHPLLVLWISQAVITFLGWQLMKGRGERFQTSLSGHIMQLLRFCLLIYPNEIDLWGNSRGQLLSKMFSSPGSYITLFLCEIRQLCPNFNWSIACDRTSLFFTLPVNTTRWPQTTPDGLSGRWMVSRTAM